MQISFDLVIVISFILLRFDEVPKSSNIITLKRRLTRIGSDNRIEFVELLEDGVYITDRRRLLGSIC